MHPERLQDKQQGRIATYLANNLSVNKSIIPEIEAKRQKRNAGTPLTLKELPHKHKILFQDPTPMLAPKINCGRQDTR